MDEEPSKLQLGIGSTKNFEFGKRDGRNWELGARIM